MSLESYLARGVSSHHNLDDLDLACCSHVDLEDKGICRTSVGVEYHPSLVLARVPSDLMT